MNASLRAAVYALRWAFEIGVAGRAAHRDRGHDLAVRVDDDDGDGPGRGVEHARDDGEGLVVGHFDCAKNGASAPSRNGRESTARPPENGNWRARRTTSEKPMIMAIVPAPIAWNAALLEPTSVT